MTGTVAIAAVLIMSTVGVPAIAAAPTYTDVVAGKVHASKGGTIYNYRLTAGQDIPSSADVYGNSIDAFAYVWIAGVDCSQYEDSNCGGHHATGVFAIIDPNLDGGNDDWHVVTGTFSIHPLGICNGNQAVFDIQNQPGAEIAIKGHRMSVTMDADIATVTAGNFTSAGPLALFESPYDTDILCVGELAN